MNHAHPSGPHSSEPTSFATPAAATATTPAARKANAPNEDTHDVLIMGGGLAGLTLALQLRQRHPDLDIVVVERRQHPVPEARHKVGESTVEIGAHYFEHVLGLGEHLRGQQLRKFGFRFFFSHQRSDIENVTELGASRPLAVPSYQIDRGIFENFLGQEARRRGIRFIDGARITTLQMSEGGSPHSVSWQRQAGDTPTTTATATATATANNGNGTTTTTARARWLIDACGRASLIKRQKQLAQENAHAAHAVWFRIAERITIDDWSDDPAWRERCATPTRWLSTNHLVGPGYWVWLIPLASGSHSVGIVADPRWHPHEEMNTFERAMQWIARHQPRLAQDLKARLGSAGENGVQPEKLQDFAFLRRFSHDCKQIFSTERWALTGEAGRFLDPFYSPGSDFIAMGNTYITELISRDLAGRPLAAHTQIYEQIFRSFYDSTLALYQDQYGLFGEPEVMPNKVLWDYTYYWGVLAQLACQGRLGDLATLSHLRDELALCQRLNEGVQNLLRAWGERSAKRNPAVMLDQASVPWFAELNRSLHDQQDDAAFRARLQHGTQRLHALATQLLARATQQIEHDRSGFDAAVAPLRELLQGSARAAAAAAALATGPAGAAAPFEDMLFAAQAEPVPA
jgi:flavin-dependent dehydrogenase